MSDKLESVKSTTMIPVVVVMKKLKIALIVALVVSLTGVVSGCGSDSSPKYTPQQLRDAEVGHQWYEGAKKVDSYNKR